MAKCLIALGSNLGDRRRNLDEAMRLLAAHDQLEILAESSAFETAAIGGPPDQANFLNAAATARTSLSPDELLQTLQATEQALGRRRGERWSARNIDLDLLLYDELTVRSPHLCVPHPRMACRNFVMAPAAEVAGEMIDPVSGMSLAALWRHLQQATNYVALVGPPGTDAANLSSKAVNQLADNFHFDAKVFSLGNAIERAREDPTDPTGPGVGRAIELLQKRCQELGRFCTAAATSWIVASFWFEQVVAEILAGCAETEMDHVQDLSEAIRDEVLRPKLLVVLPPTRVGRDRGTEKELADLVRRRHQGPILELDLCDGEDETGQVVAAILAMHEKPIRIEASRP